MSAQERIYTVEEAAEKIKIAADLLHAWVREEIAPPSFLADGKEPLFADDDLARLEQIRRLHEIGFGIQEIKKISRKIGLPKPEPKKDRPREVRRCLTVGELASRSGLNPRTIKYWEERGIIEPSGRSEGGFRLYDESYVPICNLIQDLQIFGYNLEEIKAIADLFRIYNDLSASRFEGGDDRVLDLLDAMRNQIEQVSQRIDSLSKGIDRWRKLLKEKRSEISSMRKRYSRAREANPTPVSPPEPAGGESSS
ncbi:MAG: MerR family transcriptional regulator [Myxococcales bacterium]|nr:MAG: MerR family transcriptional regulator [Myxococcales bacterium]